MCTREGSARRKTKPSQFAYYQEPSCPLRRKLSLHGHGRGLRAVSITRQQSFGKSISTNRATHHDALEFRDGKIVLLTKLKPGQRATVFQLPAGAVDFKDR